MSIYDDVVAAESLFDDCFCWETGEIDEEKEKMAQQLLQEVLDNGIEVLCKIRANKLAMAESLRNEEKRLADKRKSIENKIDRLESFIGDLHNKTDKDKTVVGNFTVSFRMSEQVSLADGFENKDFGKYEFKADKVAIKKALKSGQQIDGAEITTNLNLQVK